MKRSTFIAASLTVLALPFTALAQTDWPQKPVTMVVPYPPGGVNDAVARIYANSCVATNATSLPSSTNSRPQKCSLTVAT